LTVIVAVAVKVAVAIELAPRLVGAKLTRLARRSGAPGRAPKPTTVPSRVPT